MSPSFDPIAPWPLIALVAVAIVVLTWLAYRRRLRGTTGAWRWVALGLRLAAVVLCILAALRPSMVLYKKQKQATTVLFLTDISASMGLAGEVGGQTRYEAARRSLAEGLEAVKKLGDQTSARSLLFDGTLQEDNPETPVETKGRQTALGTALEEALKRFEQMKILRIVVQSDGGSNTGPDPRAIARTLGNQKIPIVAVKFGSDVGDEGGKDIAVRDVEAGQFVYAKTELEVFGRLDVRGFAGQTLEVELLVDGKPTGKKYAVPIPAGATEVPIRGIKWIPETPGETKLTLSVTPKPGEVQKANNQSSTYVTVLKGGIGVLYLAGPGSPWERKFMARALLGSQKLQTTQKVLFEPAGRELDAELGSAKYDVIILGDLPASYLSRDQQQLLVQAVNRGAGLMMLGGRNSFGAGGWARTPLGDLLPVEIHPGDGQDEPETGLKAVPNPLGLDSYVLRIAPTRAESQQLWAELPPMGGANRFKLKPAARLWATTDKGEPLIAAIEPGRGRVIAFGGETWPWARSDKEAVRLGHLNFWRNAILWMAHKEDEGESQVRLELDRRRVALGQKLGLTASARDAKGAPLEGVTFETKVVRDDVQDAKPENVALFRQGDTSGGSYFATADPGEYKVELTATKAGQTVGTASARFIVFDDGRELRAPTADPKLLEAIARESGGTYLPPEQLGEHLAGLGTEIVPDYVQQREVRLWDNWPFLLVFTTLLTLEWFLRKRNGWV